MDRKLGIWLGWEGGGVIISVRSSDASPCLMYLMCFDHLNISSSKMPQVPQDFPCTTSEKYHINTLVIM